MREERRVKSPDLATHLPSATHFVLQPLALAAQPSLKVSIQWSKTVSGAERWKRPQ